ncbi:MULTISPECIES: VCBS repeat-containing protein [unclassified Streptomyces]|uniref:VCBS repeat-containing protein n=1 Tax=unclassified Streptomyces TaxID=2593676 RepID=UPI001660A1FA|nr:MULTISPECIES: VCBS repeat-containing protein [unclassified Streptomyces]
MRRPRARIAVLTTALLASGAALGQPTMAAQTAGVERLDITPSLRTEPRHDTVAAVGPTGYAHTPEPADGRTGAPLEWTDFATGGSVTLGTGAGATGTGSTGSAFGDFAEFGTGGRYAYVTQSGAPALRDLTTGAQRPLAVPPNARYQALLGETVLFREYASAEAPGTATGFLLTRADDPAAPPVPVTGWPADARPATARLVAGDGTAAVLRFGRAAGSSDATDLGLVDLRTGALTVLPMPAGAEVGAVAVSPDRLVWVDGDRVAHLRERTAPTGAERLLSLPGGLSPSRIGLVGEWVLALGDTPGPALTRTLLALHPDGRTQKLLGGAEGGLTQIAGGGAAVVGGASATDWALFRIQPGKNGGAPALEKLRRIDPLPVRTDGIALGGGRLTTLEQDGPKGPGFYGRTLPVGPVRTGQSAPAWQGAEPGAERLPTPLFDGGDGRTVSFPRLPAAGRAVVARTVDGRTVRVPVGQDGRIADAFGRWAVFQTGTPAAGQLVAGGETLVVDTEAARTVSRQAQTAAALWGDTLFTGTGTGGEVARKDLTTGKDLGKIATGSGCPLTELQTAGGRWLYWACGAYAKQGVVDLRSGARIALPASYGTGGLLGDGYYVDQYSSYLRLVDVSSGRAVTSTLPSTTPVPGGRRESWAVDRFGGGIAYKDTADLVHVMWPGVPASDLTTVGTGAPGTLRAATDWKASWPLSKPVSIWQLTLRHKATGTVLRTYGGNEARGRLGALWNGKDASGRPAVNGAYTWTLWAKPADGRGPDLTFSGTVAVTGGTPVWHDLVGEDGFGDLLVMDKTGVVSLYRGTGTGALSGRVAGSTARFAAATLLVPFGDVNGDRCPDVLVRQGDQLRAYRPGCGKVLTPSSPYTVIGSGWKQYDQLTSPGDMNGDGYADLVARQASTGDMYFYGGTADHRLKARVRIGTNWKTYKRIIGVGDLNGDRRGDLLGLDTAGVLWKYHATATGGVTARTKTGWGAFTAVTGAGDLTGDARPDLLTRDTAGRLWRYNGPSFTTRTLVGTGGWNTFASLS